MLHLIANLLTKLEEIIEKQANHLVKSGLSKQQEKIWIIEPNINLNHKGSVPIVEIGQDSQ